MCLLLWHFLIINLAVIFIIVGCFIVSTGMLTQRYTIRLYGIYFKHNKFNDSLIAFNVSSVGDFIVYNIHYIIFYDTICMGKRLRFLPALPAMPEFLRSESGMLANGGITNPCRMAIPGCSSAKREKPNHLLCLRNGRAQKLSGIGWLAFKTVIPQLRNSCILVFARLALYTFLSGT